MLQKSTLTLASVEKMVAQCMTFFSLADVKADGATVDAVANGKVMVDEGGKKERSVLQAKLTRLAIQIGYAGILLL